MSEEELIQLIEADQWMMELLHIVDCLDLPDWWICAGFVRAKVWDTLHHFKHRTPLPDIDVIYFNKHDIDEAIEKKYEQKLKGMKPNIPWSVKNEARMHIVNDIKPYQSSVDAISKFPETATALGVKLDKQKRVVLAAPCGIEDVVGLRIKPTPFFAETEERLQIYKKRIVTKNWPAIWSRLEVHFS